MPGGKLETVFSLLFALVLPQEASREHAETVRSSSHEYRLTLGGVMDAANTRNPIGYSAPIQWFEPMRSVRMENVGDRDVVNPWLLVNGKRRWRTARDIAAEALATYGDPATMSDGERARAIWEYQRHHRFHATTWDAEVWDPVKAYNVYGYTLCGDEAPVLMDLWRLAGLKVRRGFPTGHVVGEVWYDGAWHLLDSDEHVICLLRDNRTIAGEEEVVRDHDLVKRTHTYGILARDDRKTDEFSASLYIHEGKRQGEHRSNLGHTMDFTLRAGEALEWRWDHAGKHHTAGQGLREGWSETAWARLRNGRWSYRPEPKGDLWRVSTPYVIVGGRLRARGGGLSFSISFDGKGWTPVGKVEGAEAEVTLDPFFPSKGPARYSYRIRRDAGEVESLVLENDLQMAALGLPSLELGENVLTYSDETREPHAVRITHRWVERDGAPPPAPPAAPVSPVDGGEVEGTRVAFEWQASKAAKVVDYQFQLGDRPDLRWVLSPNFDKLVSHTADRGKPRYALPYEGLLNPGERYYWRVRAMDDRHVWGAWSPVWSFVARGPGVPLHLRWEAGRLAWEANPAGGAPVRFEVYGSSEKGFTASDRDYPVFVGNQKSDGLYPGKEILRFPSNRIAVVSGPNLELRPTCAFYRVIAVDEKGVKSGASDYLAARRPFITTDPVKEAKAGAPYRYEAKTVFSIGDLRCRTIGGESYNAAFWDAEKPRFALEAGPAWLKVDAETGVLSGTPRAEDAGEREVRLAVEIPGVGKDVQQFTLRCTLP